jgi:CheY-like chemotaxis protein
MITMKAVILDDDPVFLTVLCELLGCRGYEVEAYPSPSLCPLYSDRTSTSAREWPDIILTDFNMPAVNGIEFVEELRRRGCTCKHIALIAGQNPDSSLRHRAAMLGLKFIPKPFRLQQFEGWLDETERACA